MGEARVIRPEDLDAAWPDVADMIEQATATSRGKETAFDVRRAIRAGDAQLLVWCGDDGKPMAAFVTELVRYPRKLVARIRIAVGSGREEWQDQMTLIERWARDNGAAGIELIARPGWARVLRPQGFDMTHAVLEKEL